jgi:hypothetical protein
MRIADVQVYTTAAECSRCRAYIGCPIPQVRWLLYLANLARVIGTSKLQQYIHEHLKGLL